MVEKIKAWIAARKKFKRATAEQLAADAIIGQVERALGLELYDWQRLYIITGIWQPPAGRLQGRTLAYILRLLLDQSQPLLLCELQYVRAYADNPFTEQYRPVPTHYAGWFKRELSHIHTALQEAGVQTREVIFRESHQTIARW